METTRENGLSMQTCSGPECNRATRRNGLCDTHSAMVRNGRPLIPIVTKGTKVYWNRDSNGNLRCMDCLEHKADTEFYKNANNRTGFQLYCKPCEKDRKIYRTYGITGAEYRALIELQGNKCAICFEPPGQKALAVDHDHSCCDGSTSCGKCVRRLLCNRCNTMIGLARDNAALLLLASQYLDDFRTVGSVTT